ncbi:YqzE family protein [Paenibacillus sp. MMS18-CY102]|uniref:YqzE family protein n=1 Tax=Paenibacillus sp. MMS18-CY102 TaxID=2682849 RepID=UPI0013661388|nr:YqzE family protein [Paenibacillus sp. MMS18-CY102]MWC29314.1 YqzE family protein [Paenibacillus sp. MMS18-CY102]
MADKRDELIKYMAGQFVHYIDTPVEEREQRRRNKQAAKSAREPWVTRWFGLAPVTLFTALFTWMRGMRGTAPSTVKAAEGREQG